MPGIVLDDQFTRHRQQGNHPERPERILAIRSALEEDNLLGACLKLPVRPADACALELNHSPEYIRKFRQACEDCVGITEFEDDYICRESFDVASRAAGSVVNAIDAIMTGMCKTAFCAVRPPGHHAEETLSGGFCYFNNIAIGARHLLTTYGLERVLIFDWDAHHGDGTQKSFYDDPRVLLCSFHVDPRFLYPRVTGFSNETGSGAAVGTKINVPLAVGDGPDEYKDAFMERFLEAARDFQPEFVLVSAGFDGHKDDPLGKLKLGEDTYAWLTQHLLDIADEYAQGRFLSVLEGGYNLEALGRCVREHVKELVLREETGGWGV